MLDTDWLVRTLRMLAAEFEFVLNSCHVVLIVMGEHIIDRLRSIQVDQLTDGRLD